VQDDLLSVELLVHKHVQVVLLFLDVDGDVDTGASDRDGDGLCVVLVLEEKREVLANLRQLHWNETELDLGAAVTVDFSGALEADLGQEFIEDVGVGRLVSILLIRDMHCAKHIRTNWMASLPCAK